jgi:hypothetical protein
MHKTPAEIGAKALWMAIRKVYLAAIKRVFLVRPSMPTLSFMGYRPV